MALNDLHVNDSRYFTGTESISYNITVFTSGPPDVFDWTDTKGGTGNSIAITGDWQALSYGVEIMFDATSGHTENDQWQFDCTSSLTLSISGDNVGIGKNPTYKLDVNGITNVNSNRIINVATPTSSDDAVNKAYVDLQDSTNLTSANTYTDTASSNLVDYINSQDSSVLSQANTYTDTASSNLVDYINQEIADVSVDLQGVTDNGATSNNTITLTNAGTGLIIDGITLFNSFPITPSSAPTTDYQVANKKYVDDNAGSGESITTKSADYTVLDDDGFTVILFDCTAAARVCTLPTASANTDRKMTLKAINNTTYNLTIDGEGAETIDGSATYVTTTPNQSITVVCDGTSWYII